MTNPTSTTPTPPRKARPIDESPPDREADRSQQAAGDDSAQQRPTGAGTTTQDRNPGRVEIGEPVPEEDRTVRAGEAELPVDEDDPDLAIDPDPDPDSDPDDPGTERH